MSLIIVSRGNRNGSEIKNTCLGSVLSTNMTAVMPLLRDQMPSSGFLRYQEFTWCMYIHVEKTFLHIINV